MNFILVSYDFLYENLPLTHSFKFKNKKIVKPNLLLQVIKSVDVFFFFFAESSVLDFRSFQVASGAKAESRDRKFFG